MLTGWQLVLPYVSPQVGRTPISANVSAPHPSLLVPDRSCGPLPSSSANHPASSETDALKRSNLPRQDAEPGTSLWGLSESPTIRYEATT
jgi:hypothetical protein